MASYVNQDLSGQSFVGASLIGANFTGANATNTNFTGANCTTANFTNTNCTNANFTNVNLTNANITNTTFRNTLITGATITGITFSNVQKGELLLRTANIGITSINNLTALTIQEFRVIQPAISVRSLNTIQTVTVIVPNNTGQGYTVSVTPVINQVVCIFVAVNQNIVLSSSGNLVRMIRSNGTVIQDVSNGNVTLPLLRVGGVPYRLSVGNGDGVITMIPLDMNLYQVNGSGLGDIISLGQSGSSQVYNLYWGDGTAKCAKITFTLPSIVDLRFNKVRVSLKVRSFLNYLNYPILCFNDNHIYPSSNNSSTEMSTQTNIWTGANTYFAFPNNTPTQVLWNDGSMCFMGTATPTNVTDAYYILNFWIELVNDRATGTFKQMIAKGDWVLVDKANGSKTNINFWNGTFTRLSELAGGVSTLTKIGFGSFSNGGNFSNAIRGATINVEVIPTSPEYQSGGSTL